MGGQRESPPASESRALERLTRRKQFLNAAKGKRCSSAAFSLQSALSYSTVPAGDSRPTTPEVNNCPSGLPFAPPRPQRSTLPRFGITVTKKIGCAVVRNRIRRRLKEALRELAPLPARHGHDYVIVARREALRMPFALLKESLATALVRIHAASETSSKARRPRKDRTAEAPKA
jgi:ribonuclease P protein component